VTVPPDLEPKDDRALLAAHLAGDDTAFGVLFARHRDRLWAVALRTTGDPDEAADALQDAMIAAFRRAGSYRGDAAVTTWLHRIVVNACLDRLRRRKVRLTDPLPNDLDDPPRRHAHEERAQVDPAEVAESHERRRLVMAALDRLPPDQRAALVLVDMEGYSVAEAAELLDLPAGTVKSRCSRGRARLLPLLVESGLVDRGVAERRGLPGNQRPSPHVSSPNEPRDGSTRRRNPPEEVSSP
jgi:RNA polymerase sigma-70 factor (ECF subfamily)